MRKITPKAIAQFASIVSAELLVSISISFYVISPYLPETFQGFGAIILSMVVFYLLAIAGFRLLQKFAPVPHGTIPADSAGEHRAFLYMLHYILLFNPLLFGRILPFPILGLLLKSLGAKIGSNSYCAGICMDPQFVVIGNDSVIGNDAMLIAHIIEGHELAYETIRIGNNVTVGARAIIMAGVTIDDGAIIGVQSVVRKGSHIRSGETWVGCPAKRIEASSEKAIS